MHPKLESLLACSAFARGHDGIYAAPLPPSASDQEAERQLRESIAALHYDDYLIAIARDHSIPVMDHEVDRFLASMPRGALILDIGGGWGWHWRRLAVTRPDVGAVIVDFVRANLNHARKMLGTLVGDQVMLLHADATALPFPDAAAGAAGFDGVWSVQVFQHIPDFPRACREAHRVLMPGGRFVNYSRYATPLDRMIYRMLGRPFHIAGTMKNLFHLTLATDSQRQVVTDLFGEVTDRYTECLFHPNLKLAFTGRMGSSLGNLDAYLGDVPWLGRWIARQRSVEATKL